VLATDKVYKLNRRSRYNHTMKMESSEVFDSLEGHLKATDEMDLVVLRGHLILEQCLNAAFGTARRHPPR
jgi:hypothetical protein